MDARKRVKKALYLKRADRISRDLRESSCISLLKKNKCLDLPEKYLMISSGLHPVQIFDDIMSISKVKENLQYQLA